MKKLLFGAAALLLLAGCSGSGNNETTDEASQDSTAITVADDSVKATPDAPEADKAPDKTTQEATKPSPNAKKIDQYLNGYMKDAKQYRQAVKNGMMGYELGELRKYGNIAKKRLQKFEKEMTPEQKEKFQKANKMFN